jgi:RsmE family RNA methyltransferase
VNLILLEREELRHDSTARLTGTRAAHVRDVLRAVPGETIRIGVINDRRGTATVETIENDDVIVRCSLSGLPPQRAAVDLLLALPRPKVMRRLFAQCAALGVDRLMLTNASRVERHYFDTHILAPASYRPLLIEGLQQAGDTQLPTVTIHRQFRMLVEDDLGAVAAGTLRVVAHPGSGVRVHDAIAACATSRVLIALGPEGGWNDFELTLLESCGFTAISMGMRVLRSDTACVALLALTHEALNASRRRDPVSLTQSADTGVVCQRRS